VIGATFVGPTALVGGAGILLWGLAVHMMASAAFGVIFAALMRRETPPSTALLAGLAYGLAVMVVMTWVVVPFTNHVMHDRIPLMWGSWIIQHALFGVGVSLAPYFRRRFSGTEGQPQVAQPAYRER
jgi:hypothetical protein